MIRFQQIPKDTRLRVDDLTRLFKKNSNIVFAYLFGGLLRDRPNPLSDVDLAVYLKKVEALNTLELFHAVAKVLGTDEIDLVVLNKAPLSLTGRILQNRKVLIDKNPFLRHKYESLVLRMFFDFAMKERDILKRRYGIG